MSDDADTTLTAQADTNAEGDAQTTPPVTDDSATVATEADTATTEQKPAENEATGDAEGKDDAETGAPESYDLKAPEGSALAEEQVTQVADLAKDLGLSQEQAEKLLGHSDAMLSAQREALDNEWIAMRDGWADETKAKFSDEQITLAQKALKQFGSEEFAATLNQTGYGNHPELVAVFANIGAHLAEDTPEEGASGNAPSPKTQAERMFGQKA
jgi:hypothetical protein